MQKITIFLASFIALAPFINSSFSNIYKINIYLISALVVVLISLITVKIDKLRLNKYDLLLFILLDLFFIFFSINRDFYIFLSYQFLIFSLFFLLFTYSKSRVNQIINIPYQMILLYLFFIFISEYSGIIMNILTSARAAVAGNVLGLSLIFNFGALIVYIKSIQENNRKLFFLAIFLSLISFVFFKTKGPIVALLISGILIRGISFKSIIIISLGGSVLNFLSSLSIFRAQSEGSSSFEVRTKLYLEILNLFKNNFFNLNLIDERPFRFHNWILESYWRIGGLAIIYILLTVIIILYYKYSIYFKWSGFYLLTCGLFSFELETILFAFTIFSMLTILESNINKKALLNSE